MEPLNPELEARIAEHPDDLVLRRAYADWLKQANNPRGELAALQLAGDDAAANTFLDANAELFFGPESPALKSSIYDLTWCGGFWDTLEIDEPRHEVRTHPSARLLRKLDLVMYGPFDWAVDALATGQYPALRSLSLGGNHIEGQDMGEMADWTCNNLGLLAHVMPHLEKLTLTCGVFRFADFPALREFICDGYSLRVESLQSLLAANLPSLETLQLNIDFMMHEIEYELIQAQHFEPLFSGKVFPKLRELTVTKLSSAFEKAATESALARRANIVITR